MYQRRDPNIRDLKDHHSHARNLGSFQKNKLEHMNSAIRLQCSNSQLGAEHIMDL